MGIDEGKLILLDTNCFIYYMEDHDEFADALEEVFSNIQTGRNNACISVLTLLEILVKPKRENNIFLENRYKLMLSNYPNLSMVDVGYRISDTASRLRAKHNIKTPDAIILATCIITKSDYFISNDVRLKSICDKEKINMINIKEIRS